MRARRANLIKTIIGSNLRKFRTNMGMSQAELGKKLAEPVLYQTIQRWEAGTANIPSERLYDLAKILNVDPGDFFAGCDAADDTTDTHQARAEHDSRARETRLLLQSYFSIRSETARHTTRAFVAELARLLNLTDMAR